MNLFSFMNVTEKLTQGFTQGTLFRAYLIPALFMFFIGTFTYSGDVLSKNPTPHEPIQPHELVDAEVASSNAPVFDAAALDAVVRQARLSPQKATPLPAEQIDTETLWLARCIYSETKRPEEQELVAWVVRNRVETGYRGKRTYKDVVLDPYQFSAFNPGDRKRAHYTSLTTSERSAGWQNALNIAYHVRFAEAGVRPFPTKTRHFYSEQSMVGELHPEWSEGMKPVKPQRPVQLEEKRFRFYEGVR